MDINVILNYAMYGTIILALLMATVGGVLWKYIMMGIKIEWFGRKKALMFLKASEGELEGPFFVPRGANNVELKRGKEKKTYIYDGIALKGPRLFNMPFFIYDENDTKVTTGMYYHQTHIKEVEGEKESLPIKGTFQYVDQNGQTKVLKNHPLLLPQKNSVVVPPKLIQAVISTEAITKMLKQFFDRNKTMLYYAMGIAIGVGIVIYLVYEWLPNKITEIVALELSKVMPK